MRERVGMHTAQWHAEIDMHGVNAIKTISCMHMCMQSSLRMYARMLVYMYVCIISGKHVFFKAFMKKPSSWSQKDRADAAKIISYIACMQGMYPKLRSIK